MRRSGVLTLPSARAGFRSPGESVLPRYVSRCGRTGWIPGADEFAVGPAGQAKALQRRCRAAACSDRKSLTRHSKSLGVPA